MQDDIIHIYFNICHILMYVINNVGYVRLGYILSVEFQFFVMFAYINTTFRKLQCIKQSCSLLM